MYTEAGKAKYKETRRLIRQAKEDKQLVLFIGAGTSVDSGVPLWSDAIAEIAKKLDMDPTKSDTLVIPQYYYNARGKKEYTQLMRVIFKHDEKLETKPVHKKIMEFDAETIITTNYDHLLKQAAEENGVFLNVIARDSDLPYRKATKELIKMHGDFEHDNFVLKEDDYLHYHQNFKLIENYVKSIIGTKTVLFIGYSLSDPDVKQIFSWAKEILDEDFQRAYLINTRDEYNENINDYFRHLGVNLIFSKELLETLSDNQSENLNRTLDFLLDDDDENDRGLIDHLYEELKPFYSINYTYRSYIDHAIMSKRGTHIYISNGYISNSDKNDEEEKNFATSIASAIRGEKLNNNKENVIYEALRKSNIQGITVQNEKGEFKKLSFPALRQEEYEEAVYTFNFKKLEDIRDSLFEQLSDLYPQIYMKQAAVCCELHEYETAYHCLENAARIFYKGKQFGWYFIAQWDKIRVGQIINQMERWKINEEEADRIKKEIQSIDLEKTVVSIPDLGNRHNKFLKDLIDFKFSSELFYQTYKTSRDVMQESRKTYMLHTALPAYDKLREMINDYYAYCSKNYLVVDRYSENTEIYHLFARSMFFSYSVPDKTYDGDSFAFESRNY